MQSIWNSIKNFEKFFARHSKDSLTNFFMVIHAQMSFPSYFIVKCRGNQGKPKAYKSVQRGSGGRRIGQNEQIYFLDYLNFNFLNSTQCMPDIYVLLVSTLGLFPNFVKCFFTRTLHYGDVIVKCIAQKVAYLTSIFRVQFRYLQIYLTLNMYKVYKGVSGSKNRPDCADILCGLPKMLNIFNSSIMYC